MRAWLDRKEITNGVALAGMLAYSIISFLLGWWVL